MYKRILLPIDGSELSAVAAEAGVCLARSEGAEVFGLVVLSPSPSVGPSFFPDEFSTTTPLEGTYELRAREKAQRYLDRVSKAASVAGVKMDASVVFSYSVHDEIIAAAKRHDCDLIVMGSHGRTGLSRAVLGSVTRKVLAACDVPVLVHRLRVPAKTPVSANQNAVA